MEPTSSNQSPEQSPASQTSGEGLPHPEVASQLSGTPAGANAPTPSASGPLPAPISNAASTPFLDPADPPSVSGPAVAADVDVIEKEWVDKTEAVIKATAGDPHAEESQVEDLQVDYLKKRYGKDIKKSAE